MNARELRAEISREATRLARIQVLAEVAGAGADASERDIEGGVVEMRLAFEGLAELAHASWYRLSVLAEEPKPAASPPRKRKPALTVVNAA